jgi:uncharacterized protein YceK
VKKALKLHMEMIRMAVLVFLVLSLILGFSGCSNVEVSSNREGTAIFKVFDKDIEAEMSEEDTKTLAEIFNGKDIYSSFSSVPSCGFSNDVSVKIGTKTFCFAMDGCSTIRVGLSFFDVSEEENEGIKAILEKYGFHFPCV